MICCEFSIELSFSINDGNGLNQLSYTVEMGSDNDMLQLADELSKYGRVLVL